jgi:hypothetical protein
VDTTVTAAAPLEADDSLDDISLDDAILLDDDDDFTDEELEELLERAKPLVDTYTPPVTKLSEEPTMNRAERATLQKNIETMEAQEFLADHLTIATARYCPDELKRHLIPEHFPGLKSASWQMLNPTRFQIHAKAQLALGQAVSPGVDQERPRYGNGSLNSI